MCSQLSRIEINFDYEASTFFKSTKKKLIRPTLCRFHEVVPQSKSLNTEVNVLKEFATQLSKLSSSST